MVFNDIKDFYLKKILKNNFQIGTPSDSVASSLTFGTGDSEIVFTAVDSGIQGDNISVSILDSGESDSSFSISFDIITRELIIYPEKISNSVTSTSSDIADSLNSDVTVLAYLSVTGGSGVVDLQAKTSLSGGSNGTEGIGKFTEYIYNDNIYFCLDDADFSSTGKWRKVGSEISYDGVFNYDEILDYDSILD